jgi:5-methyltetrahydrofolate--homocysteine methyltransferase
VTASFLERVAEGPLLFDGGMGSLLIAQGLASGEAPEPWNVERPEVVRDAHRAYFDAGSDVVITNTFGGSRLKLDSKGLGDRVEELNRAAVGVALSVRREGRFVAGDVGPTGRVTGLPGAISYEALKESFAEQAHALADAGADLLAVETMYDLEEAKAAVTAAHETHLPVTATMTFERKPQGFFTLMGNRPEECLAVLEECGASVVGANCTLGPEDMLDLLKAMRPHTSRPILIQPNAGQPELVDGKAVYSAEPQSFAGYIRQMLDEGANLVGGCCGTTPEFIRLIASEIRGYLAGR